MISQCLKILNAILFPSHCANCEIFHSTGHILCKSCKDTIKSLVPVNLPLAAGCFMSVYSIGLYADPLRKLILAKSYGRRYIGVSLGKMLGEYIPFNHITFDVIVPVPLHWTRYAKRGFNQSEVMAQVIAKQTGKPLVHLLKRKKRTKLQASLTQKERNENLVQAFTLMDKAEDFKYASILLIDDLMTTGSTLHYAGRTLLALKPKNLHAAVVCRTI